MSEELQRRSQGDALRRRGRLPKTWQQFPNRAYDGTSGPAQERRAPSLSAAPTTRCKRLRLRVIFRSSLCPLFGLRVWIDEVRAGELAQEIVNLGGEFFAERDYFAYLVDRSATYLRWQTVNSRPS